MAGEALVWGRVHLVTCRRQHSLSRALQDLQATSALWAAPYPVVQGVQCGKWLARATSAAVSTHVLGHPPGKSPHWRQGCPSTMAFFIGTMGYTAGRPHTCRNVDAAGTCLVDVSGAMKDRVETLTVEQVAPPARRIWEAVRSEFYGTVNEHFVCGLSEPQVLRRVYQARSQHFSGNVHGAIEIPPLSTALNGGVSFFQFHYVTVNRENPSKPTPLIGWAHPSLINLLRYNGTTIFVDGTFRCVPPPLATSSVIFMVHDRASGLYFPVYYVFSTSRSGNSLWDMVHFVVQSSDQQLEPAEVVCDFDSALIDAVQT